MNRETIPFRKGLFAENADGVGLLASKCRSCGRIFFPKKNHCFDCFSHDMEQVMLRGSSKLYTFTIVRMPAEHYAAPYAIGWVEFPEGVRVFGQIRAWERQPLKIGMEMKLVIDTLWQEKEKQVIGYKFEPIFKDSKE